MRMVSMDWKRAMQTSRKFYACGVIAFADGQTEYVSRDDLRISGNYITDAAETSSFPLGVLVAKQIVLILENYDDRWSDYDFAYARVTLQTRFDVENVSNEWLNIGTYTVIQPESYGDTIELIAMDDSYKTDKEYTSDLSFPVALGIAVQDSCKTCGISLKTINFANNSYVIPKKPESLTHREFIGMCAMIAGGNASFDENGELAIRTYDLSLFRELGMLDGGWFDEIPNDKQPEDTADGGTFWPWNKGYEWDGGTFEDWDATPFNGGYFREDEQTVYQTGDKADGGTFLPWSVGTIWDEGDFLERDDHLHVFFEFKPGLTIAVDDVYITGVQMQGIDKINHLYGSEGYVLTLNNDLAAGKEDEALKLIGEKIVGLRFRPFSGDHTAYPMAEFMDLAYVIDWKNRVYQTVLTDVTFNYAGYTSIGCSADSPIRNSSKYYDNSDRITEKVSKNQDALSASVDNLSESVGNLSSNTEQQFNAVDSTMQDLMKTIQEQQKEIENLKEQLQGVQEVQKKQAQALLTK